MMTRKRSPSPAAKKSRLLRSQFRWKPPRNDTCLFRRTPNTLAPYPRPGTEQLRPLQKRLLGPFRTSHRLFFEWNVNNQLIACRQNMANLVPKLRPVVHRWFALGRSNPEICVEIHSCSCFAANFGHNSFHWNCSLLQSSSVRACGPLVECNASLFCESKTRRRHPLKKILNKFVVMGCSGVVGTCDTAIPELWPDREEEWAWQVDIILRL